MRTLPATAALTAALTAAAALTAVALLPAAPAAANPAAADPTAANRAAASPVAASRVVPTAGPAAGACPVGALCLWDRAGFTGERRTHELSATDIESCVPLPAGTTAESFANRTGRPVTTYQSAVCGETGEFDTYPGDGTWVPASPYQVRAFKIWEN
ncbi:peptidase inhibitor family I36 protein [Streptomyces zingiberis]|uniref:Peptidase inhibitor family I36 protein n=1 Tax=Streptomyces zingiberis TaxID=2053010 RepID=A0ABX1BTL5_9ACTN|nr:peptidase inhibitor family I36 protein [Streptomyces zingiberis]NJP99552.1 peptidase inhibitor family I36 protein [Streptomyces zingiberis]